MLMDSMPTLPPRTTSMWVELFLTSRRTTVFLAEVWKNSEKETVFSVVDDTGLEGLGNLEELRLIFGGAVQHLDVEDFLHMNGDIL